MYAKFFKRLIDIVLSILGMPILILATIVVAPLIWLEDKGPLFHNAERLGKDGKVFTMYKFRSMKVNSPNLRTTDGSAYNGDDDPRVTKIGRILRKTSVDELPQILNVFMGDMSLIGPRAHLTTSYKGYDFLSDLQKKRLCVRPGITGYSQAYYRNSITAEEKMKNDTYYVDNITFWFDVKIFFKTISAVLKRENVYISSAEKRNSEK